MFLEQESNGQPDRVRALNLCNGRLCTPDAGKILAKRICVLNRKLKQAQEDLA
jgi:hypothetical protein